MRKHSKARPQVNPNVKGLSVEVRNNDINFALRKFKRKVQEDGLLQEIRDRTFYTKPSETRKRAKAAARSRWLKQEEKLNPNLTGSRRG